MGLNVAVVGLGGIGNRHAAVYHEHDECDVVAVCDLIEEKADKGHMTDNHETVWFFAVSHRRIEQCINVFVCKPRVAIGCDVSANSAILYIQIKGDHIEGLARSAVRAYQSQINLRFGAVVFDQPLRRCYRLFSTYRSELS